MTIDPVALAESTLAQMTAAGFDDSQVSVSVSEQDELNIAHNEASLLRSTEDYSVSLAGIKDGRKAATSLTAITPEAIASAVAALAERVQSAPVDDSNAVSADQVASFEQGPLSSDLDLLADKAGELLDFRAAQAAKVTGSTRL